MASDDKINEWGLKDHRKILGSTEEKKINKIKWRDIEDNLIIGKLWLLILWKYFETSAEGQWVCVLQFLC